MIQLVCRFARPAENFWTRAKDAVGLLGSQPTCLAVRLARSTDDPQVWVLTAEFDSFAGYRSALSPFDVRTIVIPFLSEAEQEVSGVLEVLLTSTADSGGQLIESVPTVGPEISP